MFLADFNFAKGALAEFEGYIYDYLKSKKREQEYDQIISRSGTIFYFAGALGSIVGAYIFSFNINYPYYLLGLLFVTCIIVALFMDKDIQLTDDGYQNELRVFSGISHILGSVNIIV